MFSKTSPIAIKLSYSALDAPVEKFAIPARKYRCGNAEIASPN